MGTQTQKVVIHNHVNVGTKKSKRKGRRRGTSSRAKKAGSTYDDAKTIVTPAPSVDRQMMMMLQANRGFGEPMMLNDFNGAMYHGRALAAQHGGYALPSVSEMPHETVKMLGDKIDAASQKTQETFSQGYRQLHALTMKQHDLEQRLHDANNTRSDVGNLRDFDDQSSDSARPPAEPSIPTPPSTPPPPPPLIDSPQDETTPAPPKPKPPKERRSTPRPDPVPRQNKKGEWVFGGRKPTRPDQIERRNQILLAVVKKVK